MAALRWDIQEKMVEKSESKLMFWRGLNGFKYRWMDHTMECIPCTETHEAAFLLGWTVPTFVLFSAHVGLRNTPAFRSTTLF